jgi:hypothetical protein
MKRLYFAASTIYVLCLSACTPQRTQFDIQQFQDSAASAQYNQIKVQLSRSIDNPYDIPTLSTFGQTQIKSTASIQATLSRAIAPAGQTNTLGLNLGAASSEAQSTITTNTSPKAIQVMRDLYTYAVNGEQNWGPDVDYYLSNKPPEYPWLYHSRNSTPNECIQKSCQYLGKYGRYKLWSRSGKDYSDFVLSILEASSFQNAEVKIVPATPPLKKDAKSGKRPPRASSNYDLIVPSISKKPQLSPDNVIITD